MGSYTPNYSIYKPAVDEEDWGALVNTGFDDIDAQMKVNADGIATNGTAVGLNTTHRTSDGSDHTFIDQDVTSGAAPVLSGVNFTDLPGGLSADGVPEATQVGIWTGAATLEGVAGLTYEAGTLTCATFAGNLTGNVTGNVSGSSGSCTGNAATATTATTATNVVVTDDEAGAAENAVLFVADLDGSTSESVKADGTFTYNPSTGTVTATVFAGSLSGNASTVTTNANLSGPVTSVGNNTAIADKALAISKLADGTDGELITWGADGVITTVPVGTATHILTSNGAGAAPTFQAPPAGYTNLTQFVDQTAWRVFYSNTDGDVTELALGADGTFLKSNGATSAPTFATAGAEGTRGTFTDATLSSGVLTITHSLGLTTPFTLHLTVADNNQKQIIPDDVTFLTNTITVDLTSYGTLTGTWGYYYI